MHDGRRQVDSALVVSLGGVTLAEMLRSVVRHARPSQEAGRQGEGARPLRPGSPAPAIEGVKIDGSPVDVPVSDGRLVFLFLTSECRECEEAWRRALSGPVPSDRAPSDPAPSDRASSVVVVTPGPETESARRVAQRAEGGLPEQRVRVVMSSGAWHAYGVTKAPWVVEIEAGAVVRSDRFST